MLMLPPSVKVFVCTQPTDMRRSFDGLMSMVEYVLQEDPFSGHLFVFRSRRGNRVKILFWDRAGFAIFYKRLEKGTFRLPTGDEKSIEMEAAELALILEGIDLAGAQRRPRWTPRRSRTDAAG